MNITQVSDPILNVPLKISMDNSISQYETFSYETFGSMGYNNSDEIRLKIQNQDVYLFPHKSALHIVGRLQQKNGDACQHTTIVNNGICFLFDEIKYKINGEEIDRCKNPGVTSTMKGFASFNTNQGVIFENAGWVYGNKAANLVDKDGYFDVSIPLSNILGFAEDYSNVILRATHELVLIRAKNDLNAIKQTVAEEVEFQLNKIEWRMPQIILSDLQKANMLEQRSGNFFNHYPKILLYKLTLPHGEDLKKKKKGLQPETDYVIDQGWANGRSRSTSRSRTGRQSIAKRSRVEYPF